LVVATVLEIVIVVSGTVAGRAAEPPPVGRPTVIVDGTAVMMAGFSGTCAAQMPAK
jgi:hypothetical protein